MNLMLARSPAAASRLCACVILAIGATSSVWAADLSGASTTAEDPADEATIANPRPAAADASTIAVVPPVAADESTIAAVTPGASDELTIVGTPPAAADESTIAAVTLGASDELTIAGTPPAAIDVGSDYVFRPSATAVGPLPAHFEIENAPSWITFASFNGVLSGQPQASDAGTYEGITVSFTDGQSRVTLPVFTIVVHDPSAAENAADSREETLTWEPPTENVDGTPLTDLAGYYVYEGESPDSLVLVAETPATTPSYPIGDLAAGKHYFAVSAFNTSAQESDKSAVLDDPQQAWQ